MTKALQRNIQKSVAMYGDKPIIPGLYLGLSGGCCRHWNRVSGVPGTEGPWVGPLNVVSHRGDFSGHMVIEFGNVLDAARFGLDGRKHELPIENGEVVFQGIRYSDWDVEYHGGYPRPEDYE